jgi:large subunit ribosomal protein L24
MERIRKEDTVLVMKGKDRGRSGAVRLVIPKDKRVIVTGINIVKRHMRPSGPQKPGGIIEREAPMPLSVLSLSCARCKRPSRASWATGADGSKQRVCRRCKDVI